MIAIPLGLLSLPLLAPDDDPRALYDVDTYRLELRVDPSEKALGGTVTVEADALVDGLGIVQLDLIDRFEVAEVRLNGESMPFEHSDDRISCAVPDGLDAGERFALEIDYFGHPTNEDGFTGFHWASTADGSPWVNTSCQGPGAHSWWPCKASFYHPEDKPAHLFVNLEVPDDLYAVSNGRLESIRATEDGWHEFAWEHHYPLETYTVTLNVAPYVVVEDQLELPGVDGPVDWIYYVLPENAEKAAVQFTQVPELLEIFSTAFGPWPFPDSKFALVETNFWGMEHSTAVAYGSSYPLWCEQNGATDRYARRNQWFDYILVHEVAHEWWGNAVSARTWGDFWIHEGFGTYAEGVYVEFTRDRAAADEWFSQRGFGASSRLYRGDDVNSGQAYSGTIYSKGAFVLHALRHYVDDDEVWWDCLRAFNTAHRYGNAETADFIAILEEKTERQWDTFFDEWFYGEGYPLVSGTVRATDEGIEIDLLNEGSGANGFHVPLDLTWTSAGETRELRLWMPPGRFQQTVPLGARPEGLEVVHLRRVARSPSRSGVEVDNG